MESTGVTRAKTYCELLLLAKEDAEHILQHFPEGEHPSIPYTANYPSELPWLRVYQLSSYASLFFS